MAVFVFGFALLHSSLSPQIVAAQATTAGSFTFTAAGDYGANADAQAVWNRIKILNPQFNWALGDLSYAQVNEATWCSMVKAGVGQVPFILLTGNHESDGHEGDFNKFAAVDCLPFSLSNAQTVLNGIYPEQYYFDYPKANPVARFIATAPGLTMKKAGRAYTYNYAKNGTDYLYVQNLIRDAKQKNIPWVIVGMHKVCITTGEKDCEIGADFANMLIAEKVDLVLDGHVHSYERTFPLRGMTPDTRPANCVVANGLLGTNCIGSADLSNYDTTLGTIFVTVGTGGRPIAAQNNNDKEAGYFATRYGSTNPHFGVAEVTLNATDMRVKFVDARNNGATLDSFSVSKTPLSTTPPVTPVVTTPAVTTDDFVRPLPQASSIKMTYSGQCLNIPRNTKYGDRDSKTRGSVSMLQDFLYKQGYLSSAPTGYFGASTRDAAALFQSTYGIPTSNPVGIVGPASREKIRQITCERVNISATNSGQSQNTINTTSGAAEKAISIVRPAGTRADNFIAGGNLVIEVRDPAIAPASNPSLGISYRFDLLQVDRVVQYLGSETFTSNTGPYRATFLLSATLPRGTDYQVKVTPSCTVSTSPKCRQVFSNRFLISGNGTRQPPMIDTVQLLTTPYRLVSFNGSNTTVSAQNPRITFSSANGNGNLTAAFCNSATWTYTRSGNMITGTASGAVTQLACADTTLNAAEASFFAMISTGATVSRDVADDRIVMTRNNGDRFVFGRESTVITPSATVTTLSLISPVGGENWKIKSSQRVKIATTNVPAGAVALLSLNGVGTLYVTTSVPASGNIDFQIPEHVTSGDTVSDLLPGAYRITVTIYDKHPCLGLCAADFVPARILATQTSAGSVNIKRSTDPYFRVLAPTTGFVYANTNPSMVASWEWGNLPVQKFKVELLNTMVDDYDKTVADDIGQNTNTATFQITDTMINKFVEKSKGKTKDQIKGSYYLKITGLAPFPYVGLKPVTEASSPVFTITSAVAQ